MGITEYCVSAAEDINSDINKGSIGGGPIASSSNDYSDFNDYFGSSSGSNNE